MNFPIISGSFILLEIETYLKIRANVTEKLWKHNSLARKTRVGRLTFADRVFPVSF